MARATTWVEIPGTDIVFCAPSDDFDCFPADFVQVQRLTSFHDAELAQCTTEMNAMLRKLRESNQDPNRHLSLLGTPDGRLLLAWTQAAVSPLSEKDEIEKALGIR